MKHNTFHLRALRRVPGLVPVLAALFLAGCASGGNPFADMRLSEFDWFDFQEPERKDTVILARDPAALADESEVESALYDAVELSEKKRFAEARYLLADIRGIQKTDSEGYQALSGAMAVVALREGDIAAFRRVARQLDDSLGRPIRVDVAHVEVISLYRAMTFQSLPVNAPDSIRAFRERYFSQMPEPPQETSPDRSVERARL